MYDIVFISYNESNADKNWQALLERFPTAQRVHGVDGIHQAHIAAAKKAWTSMFWVVDGDAVIKRSFDFSYTVPGWDTQTVHVWNSENPINGLIYGYGGVKLLPRKLTLDIDVTTADMTTSISNKFKIMSAVSNISEFNTDEFSTWRSAFRECAKLASKSIQGQVNDETEMRLQAWLNPRRSSKFCKWAELGSKAGRDFGETYSNDLQQLRLINDFDWLKQQFDKLK